MLIKNAHVYSALQHVVSPRMRRAGDVRFSRAGGPGICRIVQVDFGESPFYAVG